MQTLIKICGLKSAGAVEAALDAGAGQIGFIFFEKSPRHLSLELAAELSAQASRRCEKVAVTVDADDHFLDRLVREVRPDWLQLHGSETPERIREVRLRFGLPVMRAIAIREEADLEAAFEAAAVSDRILFDAKPPKGADLPGGNGISFDWRLLRGEASRLEYMLSGGLDAANVARALALSGARAVDVSSGVESSPGVKDFEKMRTFVKTVREYDRTRLAGPPATAQQAGSA